MDLDILFSIWIPVSYIINIFALILLLKYTPSQMKNESITMLGIGIIYLLSPLSVVFLIAMFALYCIGVFFMSCSEACNKVSNKDG